MEFHAIANIFPMLPEAELISLAADIKTNGLLEPITVYEDKVLDGRNRYNACITAEVAPVFVFFAGDDPLNFVVSKNLARRHLDESQRGMIADRLATLPRGTNQFTMDDENSSSINRSQAAKLLNVGINLVSFARRVREQGVSELGEIVDAGKVAVSLAAKAAKLEQEKQKEFIEAIKKGEKPSKAYTKISQDRPIVNRNSEIDGGRVIIGDAKQMDLSTLGKYQVIIADPPWTYRVSRGEGVAKEQYKTLSDTEIMAMPIIQLAEDNCVLFLWGTWPKLPQALDVMQSWGFNYVTGFPWVKTTTNNLKNTPIAQVGLSYGVGYWVRGASELILIGRKGKVSAPRLKGFLGIISPNLQHSRKPDSVHEIAESLPGPYLELFGRRVRPGWTVFGNEVQGVF